MTSKHNAFWKQWGRCTYELKEILQHTKDLCKSDKIPAQGGGGPLVPPLAEELRAFVAVGKGSQYI